MLKKIHKTTRDYFSLTNKEASGLLVVFLFILFFILSPLTFSWFPNHISNKVQIEDQQKLDSLVAILDQAYQISQNKSINFSLDQKQKNKEGSSAKLKYNINTIALSSLLSFKLTDEKLSKRIIKFRDKLGGFYSIAQLDEVYGLKRPELTQIKKFLYVEDTFVPLKLQINEASFKEILSHPYLSYDEVKLIFYDGYAVP